MYSTSSTESSNKKADIFTVSQQWLYSVAGVSGEHLDDSDTMT